MGLMNSHQIIPGARTRGGIKTYTLAGIVEKPTTAVATDTLTVTGGVIEFEGRNFSVAGTLDFGSQVGAANLVSGRDYLVCAVPKYVEPVSRSAAEALGVNYYIAGTESGESLLHYYIPSSIEAAITAAGGLTTLRAARGLGTATQSQITLLNSYDEAVMKLSDPRFVGRLLDYTGVEYVLVGVYNQDNRSKLDATATMTEAQFKLFLSTQGDILADRSTYTKAAAETKYGAKRFKLKRAFGYTSQVNADADISGVELDPKQALSGTGFPKKLSDGSDLSATVTHIAVYEYYCPTFMPQGHEGLELGKYDFVTKENASALGRINPIYYNNPVEVVRTMIGKGPRTAATLYADPQPLVRVNVAIDGVGAITLTKVSDEVNMLIGF